MNKLQPKYYYYYTTIDVYKHIFFNSYVYVSSGVNGSREVMSSDDERKLLALEGVSFCRTYSVKPTLAI